MEGERVQESLLKKKHHFLLIFLTSGNSALLPQSKVIAQQLQFYTWSHFHECPSFVRFMLKFPSGSVLRQHWTSADLPLHTLLLKAHTQFSRYRPLVRCSTQFRPGVDVRTVLLSTLFFFRKFLMCRTEGPKKEALSHQIQTIQNYLFKSSYQSINHESYVGLL